MSWEKTDSISDCFPKAIHERVQVYLKETLVQPEIRHSQDEYYIGSQHVVLPGRVYSKATDGTKLSPESQIIHYCLLSRHHDGHVRESAVVWLVNHKPPSWTYAFILAALGDYVDNIVRVVCNIKDKDLITGLKVFAYSQSRFSALIRSRIISYWNEYYRTKDIRSYEPFAFMESIMFEENRDWRPPTRVERAVIGKLLSHDFPGVAALRKQLSGFWVAPIDDDGCISLKPAIAVRAKVKSRAPAALRSTGDADNPVEILLFVSNGIAAELQVIRYGPDDDYPLPPLQELAVEVED